MGSDPACATVISSSVQDGTLRVRFADGQDCEFPPEWLKRHVADNRADRSQKQYLWDSGFQSVLPRLTFDEFCSEAGKLQLCTDLERYGLYMPEVLRPRSSSRYLNRLTNLGTVDHHMYLST